MKDSHHRVAANALLGLHYTGDPSAYETIVAMTADPRPMFRAAMAWALGTIRDPRAVPVLESLAKDRIANVRRAAITALTGLNVAQERNSESPRESSENEPAGQSDLAAHSRKLCTHAK